LYFSAIYQYYDNHTDDIPRYFVETYPNGNHHNIKEDNKFGLDTVRRFKNIPHVESAKNFSLLINSSFGKTKKSYSKYIKLNIAQWISNWLDWNSNSNDEIVMTSHQNSLSETEAYHSGTWSQWMNHFLWGDRDKNNPICDRTTGSFPLKKFCTTFMSIVLGLMIIFFIVRILPFSVISMFFQHYQSMLQYFLVNGFYSKEYSNRMLVRLYRRISICLMPYFAILFPFEFATEYLLKEYDIKYILLIFNSGMWWIFWICLFKGRKIFKELGMSYLLSRIFIDWFLPFLIMIPFSFKVDKLYYYIITSAWTLMLLFWTFILIVTILKNWVEIVIYGRTRRQDGAKIFYEGVKNRSSALLYHPMIIIKRTLAIMIQMSNHYEKFKFYTPSICLSMEIIWLFYLMYSRPFKFKNKYLKKIKFWSVLSFTSLLNLVGFINQIQLIVNLIALLSIFSNDKWGDTNVILVEYTLLPIGYAILLFAILCMTSQVLKKNI